MECGVFTHSVLCAMNERKMDRSRLACCVFLLCTLYSVKHTRKRRMIRGCKQQAGAFLPNSKFSNSNSKDPNPKTQLKIHPKPATRSTCLAQHICLSSRERTSLLLRAEQCREKRSSSFPPLSCLPFPVESFVQRVPCLLPEQQKKTSFGALISYRN
jgi:hypothetical protein